MKTAVNPMTKPFSLLAQGVLDAVVSHPEFATRKRIASALRAAADRVLPKAPLHVYPSDYELGVWTANDCARSDFHAIADELEALPND